MKNVEVMVQNGKEQIFHTKNTLPEKFRIQSEKLKMEKTQ